MPIYSAEPFIPGLELSRMLYEQAVAPILAARFPRLVFSAARLGFGSDVLGFDTPRSRRNTAASAVSSSSAAVCARA